MAVVDHLGAADEGHYVPPRFIPPPCSSCGNTRLPLSRQCFPLSGTRLWVASLHLSAAPEPEGRMPFGALASPKVTYVKLQDGGWALFNDTAVRTVPIPPARPPLHTLQRRLR